MKVVSKNGGKTWSKAVTMFDTHGLLMGCARPRLLGLTPGGGVVLSGGRLNRTNHENYLWINAAGDGVAWEAISISCVHNHLEPNSTMKFGPSVNGYFAHLHELPSLVKSGPRAGFVVYMAIAEPVSCVRFAIWARMTTDKHRKLY